MKKTDLLTAGDCLKKFGDPKNANNMFVWLVPKEFQGVLPKKIYMNKAMEKPLHKALVNLGFRGLMHELQSWDGCFNIRAQKGGTAYSLHSWGLAIDVNASTNQFGKPPTLSERFVKCFTDAGFDWGGKWQTPDGMHFQLQKRFL